MPAGKPKKPVFIPGLLLLAAGAALLGGCQSAAPPSDGGSGGVRGRGSETEAPPPKEASRPRPEPSRPPWAERAERFLDGFRREILEQRWSAAAQRALPSLQEELIEESGMVPRDLCLMLLGPGADAPGEKPSTLPSTPLEMDKISRIDFRPLVYSAEKRAVTAGQIYFSNLTDPIPCRLHLTYRENSLYLTFPGWGSGSTERSAP